MLTPAEFRALGAVHSGLVTRVYNAKGNVLRGPSGISSRTLWRLDARKLIDDDRKSRGRICVQVCTAAGRAELAAHVKA
jgi:hypothetical protein